MPAPQRVVRTRLSDDLIIRSNFERPNPAALGVGFSQLIPIDPSSNRRSSGLPRPCRPLCRSVRHCLSSSHYTRQAGSQRAERKSISARPGWLARRVIFARRRASYLVQGSADHRRCLHRRIATRPRLRIQGGCRYSLVARAQWPAAGRASARDFGISPAANSACLAGVGCKHRRRYLSRNRRSAVTRPTHFRAGMANARTAGSDHPLGQDRIRFGAGRLPRFAKTALPKKIVRSSGVAKMHPPIFAIPL